MTINITAPPGGKIKQYDTDPVSPKPEQAWVLKSGSGGSGAHATTKGMPMGLLVALTYPKTTTQGGLSVSYQFSYRTKEAITRRVTIS